MRRLGVNRSLRRNRGEKIPRPSTAGFRGTGPENSGSGGAGSREQPAPRHRKLQQDACLWWSSLRVNGNVSANGCDTTQLYSNSDNPTALCRLSSMGLPKTSSLNSGTLQARDVVFIGSRFLLLFRNRGQTHQASRPAAKVAACLFDKLHPRAKLRDLSISRLRREHGTMRCSPGRLAQTPTYGERPSGAVMRPLEMTFMYTGSAAVFRVASGCGHG
jgi:hypothetical protein